MTWPQTRDEVQRTVDARLVEWERAGWIERRRGGRWKLTAEGRKALDIQAEEAGL